MSKIIILMQVLWTLREQDAPADNRYNTLQEECKFFRESLLRAILRRRMCKLLAHMDKVLILSFLTVSRHKAAKVVNRTCDT